MNYIEQYWEQIQNGEIVVSKKVYILYKKIIKDLQRNDWEWEYNHKKALYCINFIEKYCKHSKGRLGGCPFILELWQKALLSVLFGFVHKIDGVRKYRELVFIVARKNGKSALASAIGLYMLIADGEAGAEVVSCATKKDQAKIIWSESKRMVKKSPTLSKRIKCLVAELTSEFNDGSFKPLSSDSNTLDGLNVHCSIIDELHAIEDKNLYDVIIDGMTAREQPLSIIITTAGTVREGIFDIKYQECEDILKAFEGIGDYEDERTLPIIYELDSRDEWIDEKCWQKANPALGTIKSYEQLKDKVNKAKSNLLLVKNLLCKDFNLRETTIESWLTWEQLNNQATFELDKVGVTYAIGGVDLSSSVDLTSACILFRVPNDDNVYYHHMYWLPENLLEQRVNEDKIHYDIWVQRGLMRLCEGNEVHPKYITEWFKELEYEHGITLLWCGYDGWSAKYWVEEMEQQFGKCVMDGCAVIQGKKTLSSPMKHLQSDLENKKINYQNNDLTKWCLTNVSVDIDKNNNIQPIKPRNPRKRIDGVASMLNAYVIYRLKFNEYMAMIGGD
jgi:phage terminase large subunit-like protein